MNRPQQLMEEPWPWVRMAFQSILSIRALNSLSNTHCGFTPVETFDSGYY